MRRQIDELCAAIEHKETELKKCCEEKNTLLSKVAHLQCRMDSDLAQAQQQMQDYKAHVEKEVSQCLFYCSRIDVCCGMLISLYIFLPQSIDKIPILFYNQFIYFALKYYRNL